MDGRSYGDFFSLSLFLFPPFVSLYNYVIFLLLTAYDEPTCTVLFVFEENGKPLPVEVLVHLLPTYLPIISKKKMRMSLTKLVPLPASTTVLFLPWTEGGKCHCCIHSNA